MPPPSRPPRAGAPLRRAPPAVLLSLVYFAIVGGMGAWGPFLGLHLERTGHSGALIGGFLALVPLTRTLSAPLWAAIADRLRQGALLLRLAASLSVLAAGAVALGLALPGLGEAATLGLALVAFAFLRAPIGPLLDSAAVHLLVADGADPRDYGRLRLWGSVGFMGIAAVAALLVQDAPTGRPALLLATGAWAVAALLTLVLPAPDAAAPAPVLPALRALFRAPFLLPLALGLTLHGFGLGVYDMLLPMHMDGLGLGGAWTGAALALGISAEVTVMALGRRVLSAARPQHLLVLASATAALRWALVAVVTAPVLLVALQALHGIVFGVFWIAGVELMRTRAPAEVRNSAQSLLMVTAYGAGALLTGAATSAFLDSLGTAGLFGLGAAAAVGAAGCLGLGARRLSGPTGGAA